MPEDSISQLDSLDMLEDSTSQLDSLVLIALEDCSSLLNSVLCNQCERILYLYRVPPSSILPSWILRACVDLLSMRLAEMPEDCVNSIAIVL